MGENAKVEQMYVALSNDVKLLVYPHLAVIKKKDEVRPVNLDGAKILRMCDGTSTVGCIASKFSSNYYEKVRIVEFLLYAEKLGDVVMTTKPIKSEASVLEYDYLVPVHAVFEITENCNLNCFHCYRIKEKAPLYMDFEEFRKVLDFLVSHGLLGIEITGGEPTLHPQFLDIVEYAAQRLQLVGILTNGLFLPSETINRLEEYKEKIFFSISLDSHDPDYHDGFRGVPGAWKRTVANIRKLTSAGYNVRIAMTVTPNNIDHIEKTAESSVELGARMFTYSPMLPFGRAEGTSWSAKDLWRLSEVDKRVKERFKSIIPVASLEGFGTNEITNCGAGWRSITIGPDLKARMCVISDSNRDTMFRIDPSNIESSFKKASDVMSFFHDILAPGPAICGNCKFSNFCTPCVLRARYVIEKGLINPSNCKWARTVGLKKLRTYLGVDMSE